MNIILVIVIQVAMFFMIREILLNIADIVMMIVCTRRRKKKSRCKCNDCLIYQRLKKYDYKN